MTTTINRTLRDLLLEHIDGPVVVNASRFKLTRHVAIREGLIRSDLRGLRTVLPDGSIRPRTTHLTEKGRETLARALAEWAECLIAAERARDALLLEALRNAREAAAAARESESSAPLDECAVSP